MGSNKMKIVDFKDRGGATLRVQEIDGRYYPTFPPSVIRNLSSLKIRPDDVLLAGYLKTGTHWVWEIMRMLLAGTVHVPNVEKDVTMIEQIDQVHLDKLESPRVLNSHLLFEQLPPEMLKQKTKVVYTVRNPKDIVLSLYHHHVGLRDYYLYDGKLPDYFSLFFDGRMDYGSFFEHIDNWSRAVSSHPDLQLHMLNYEDLIENGPEQIKKLAEFLGVNASPELIQEIYKICNIDPMRERKGKFDLDCDGKPIMYRIGGVGHWTTKFTEEMNKEFNEWYEQNLKTIKNVFRWRFSLD